MNTTAAPNRFSHLLATRPWLLADGATGSNLFDMGLISGDAPELWNEEHPDRIARLHQGFVDAGTDIILTNTFGGTRYRLKLHQAQDRVNELNVKAAGIARAVADAAEMPRVSRARASSRSADTRACHGSSSNGPHTGHRCCFTSAIAAGTATRNHAQRRALAPSWAAPSRRSAAACTAP